MGEGMARNRKKREELAAARIKREKSVYWPQGKYKPGKNAFAFNRKEKAYDVKQEKVMRNLGGYNKYSAPKTSIDKKSKVQRITAI